tara:strand:- start:855 stop:1547 length:693 start_codon:yes stop_codon:yes gene_type:complete
MSDTKYYYIHSLDKYLSSTGGLYTDEELDYLYEVEQAWKDNLPKYSFKELMKIFPEAEPAAKRGLRNEIKYYKQKIVENNVARQDYYDKTILKAHWKEKTELKEKSDKFHDGINDRYESKIKSAMFKLSHLEGKPNTTKDSVDEIQVEEAKRVPIENFYDDKLIRTGKKAKGKCPFHKEKTPSFVIYLDQNSFYCYGCHAGGSVIDFLIRKEDKTFLQVVKELSKWEGIL